MYYCQISANHSTTLPYLKKLGIQVLFEVDYYVKSGVIRRFKSFLILIDDDDDAGRHKKINNAVITLLPSPLMMPPRLRAFCLVGRYE